MLNIMIGPQLVFLKIKNWFETIHNEKQAHGKDIT